MSRLLQWWRSLPWGSTHRNQRIMFARLERLYERRTK